MRAHRSGTLTTELARIDPSVSVLCDVHNTLVNTVLRKYANKELQDKYCLLYTSDAADE